MNEKISIRRLSMGTMVNVTWKEGKHSVHWQERVLGATAALIQVNITYCRKQCAMLLEGIALAGGPES